MYCIEASDALCRKRLGGNFGFMFAFLTPTKIFVWTLGLSFGALSVAIRGDDFKTFVARIRDSKLFSDIVGQFIWPLEGVGLTADHLVSLVIYFPALVIACCIASLCTISFVLFEKTFLKPSFFSDIKRNISSFSSDTESRLGDYIRNRKKCQLARKPFELPTKDRLIVTSSLVRDLHELRSYICIASESQKVSLSLYVPHMRGSELIFMQEFKIGQDGSDLMNFNKKAFTVEEGFIGECVRTRSVIIRRSHGVFGLFKDKYFKSFGKHDDNYSKSIICIPIRLHTNNVTFAVLSAESSDRGLFRPHFSDGNDSEEVCVKIGEVIGKHLVLLESKMIRIAVEIMLLWDREERSRVRFWQFWKR